MNVELLERFVTKSAQDSGHSFTLDGESVTAGDLGDPKGLLPLVVASIQNIYGEARGARANITSLLKPADPKTHLLGWQIERLPQIPEGALLLMANYAVREHLASPPTPKLSLPGVLPSSAMTARRCELRPHLSSLGIEPLKNVARGDEAAPGL